jgi:hypothetical protein
MPRLNLVTGRLLQALPLSATAVPDGMLAQLQVRPRAARSPKLVRATSLLPGLFDL